jgi:hypothetical protein
MDFGIRRFFEFASMALSARPRRIVADEKEDFLRDDEITDGTKR